MIHKRKIDKTDVEMLQIGYKAGFKCALKEFNVDVDEEVIEEILKESFAKTRKNFEIV